MDIYTTRQGSCPGRSSCAARALVGNLPKLKFPEPGWTPGDQQAAWSESREVFGYLANSFDQGQMPKSGHRLGCLDKLDTMIQQHDQSSASRCKSMSGHTWLVFLVCFCCFTPQASVKIAPDIDLVPHMLILQRGNGIRLFTNVGASSSDR